LTRSKGIFTYSVVITRTTVPSSSTVSSVKSGRPKFESAMLPAHGRTRAHASFVSRPTVVVIVVRRRARPILGFSETFGDYEISPRFPSSIFRGFRSLPPPGGLGFVRCTPDRGRFDKRNTLLSGDRFIFARYVRQLVVRVKCAVDRKNSRRPHRERPEIVRIRKTKTRYFEKNL